MHFEKKIPKSTKYIFQAISPLSRSRVLQEQGQEKELKQEQQQQQQQEMDLFQKYIYI